MIANGAVSEMKCEPLTICRFTHFTHDVLTGAGESTGDRKTFDTMWDASLRSTIIDSESRKVNSGPILIDILCPEPNLGRAAKLLTSQTPIHPIHQILLHCKNVR